MKRIKTIFIGTSKFAAPILKKIIDHPQFNVCCVVTSSDKPVGRKREITPSPIKIAALQGSLLILQPEKISEISEKISKLKPDLIVTASYGQIISKDILDIPKYGSINIHPSLLPKYRGPSPIQTAILNGDKITGITIMLMDEKMDSGPILAQKKVAIKNKENYQDLEKRLSLKSASFLSEILPQYIQGKIKPKNQNGAEASYTKILSRQDGQIDFKKSRPSSKLRTTSAQEIERMLLAFYPWPGVWTKIGKRRVKILKAKAVQKPSETTIKTGKGYLLLETVQPESKKPMPAKEFFRGLR